MRVSIYTTLLVLVIFYIINAFQHELPKEPHAFKIKVSSHPIVSITYDQIQGKRKRPGWVEVISNKVNESMGPYPVALEVAGSTSTGLPKTRLNFQFSKKENWIKGIKRNVLGLRNDDDWSLDPSHRDKLIFRNKLNHDLWNTIRMKKETIESRFVEVYINKKYMGLYILQEKADRKIHGHPRSKYQDNFKARVIKLFHDLSHKSKFQIGYKLNRAIARGIFKLERALTKDIKLKNATYKAQLHGADLALHNPLMMSFYQRYPKRNYLPNSSNLKDFILFINNSSKKDFEKNIWKYIDQKSTIEYMSLLLLNSGSDNTKANYFLVFKNGVFQFYPWDLDATFKQSNGGDVPYDIWGYNGNKLFKRLLDFEDFKNDLKLEWFNQRKSLFSHHSIKQIFTDYYNKANLNGALEKNHKYWKLIDPKVELNSTLKWIDRRLNFVDNKLQTDY